MHTGYLHKAICWAQAAHAALPTLLELQQSQPAQDGLKVLITWAANGEGNVLAVIRPGHEVDPEALWVACDGGLL